MYLSGDAEKNTKANEPGQTSGSNTGLNIANSVAGLLTTLFGGQKQEQQPLLGKPTTETGTSTGWWVLLGLGSVAVVTTVVLLALPKKPRSS